LEIEIGGLFTLEEMSLRNTVLQKAESVLLDKNLKSYKGVSASIDTYPDQQVDVEIVASSLFLV